MLDFEECTDETLRLLAVFRLGYVVVVRIP